MMNWQIVSYRTFISYNMTNIFLVSHVLVLFHSPKGLQSKLESTRESETITHIVLKAVQ